MGSRDDPKPTKTDTGHVFEFREAGGVVWISAERGLYRWPLGSRDDPKPTGQITGEIFQIAEAGGVVWISAERV